MNILMTAGRGEILTDRVLQRMIEDIEEETTCAFFSSWQNYIMTGQYTELYFPDTIMSATVSDCSDGVDSEKAK